MTQTNPTDITQTNAIISLIDDAIADSLGPDWTSFDAAHHVMQWLQDAGLQIVSAAFAEREARLVGALRNLENANDRACGARPQKVYDATTATRSIASSDTATRWPVRWFHAVMASASVQSSGYGPAV